MLDGFPWCNDSLCPRIASLDLDTERVDVEEVQLDQSMLTQCQTLRKKLMLQLDSLLRDTHGEWPRPGPADAVGNRDPNPAWGQLLAPGREGWCGVLGALGGEGAGGRFLWVTRKRSAPKQRKASFSSGWCGFLLPSTSQILGAQSRCQETSSAFAQPHPLLVSLWPGDPGGQYRALNLSSLPALLTTLLSLYIYFFFFFLDKLTNQMDWGR